VAFLEGLGHLGLPGNWNLRESVRLWGHLFFRRHVALHYIFLRDYRNLVPCYSWLFVCFFGVSPVFLSLESVFNWHNGISVMNLVWGLNERCQSRMLKGYLFHEQCKLRAGFEIKNNLWMHMVSFLFASGIFKMYSQYFLCEVG